MLWTLILPAWLKSMPLTGHTYQLLSPLQISEPSLSDTVPDTVWAWSVLTPGSAISPLNQDWQRNSSSYCPKNIPHYSATKKKFTNPHTKQSTNKTGFKNCSCLGKHTRQQMPIVYRTNCLISTTITQLSLIQPQMPIFTVCIYFEIITTKITQPNFSASKGLYVQPFKSFLFLTDSLLRIK